MRRVAVTPVLDDAGERVLLTRRHRFIVDLWVWELPGGYVDDGEKPGVAAAREVEEETGWRPRPVEFVLSTQPLIGNADYPQDLYLGMGAELAGEPEADEAAEVRWVPLAEAQAMNSTREFAGAMTAIGIQMPCCDGQPSADLVGKVPDSRDRSVRLEYPREVADVTDAAGAVEAGGEGQCLSAGFPRPAPARAHY